MNNSSRIISTLAFLMICISAYTQQTFPIPCGHNHYVKTLDEQFPGFHEAYKSAFDQAQNYSSTRNDEILTVSVVVHVVYKEDAVNISDEQITEVIASINADYQMQNEDADMLRPEFNAVAGNANIQFVHVATERVETETSFSISFPNVQLPDNVKSSNQGGSDAWDTDKYLNIWVCDIEVPAAIGAVFGYAYPPANLDNWPAGQEAPTPGLDGVVIHYEAFNTNNSVTVGNNTVNLRGRTVTHEVGHYLGLRHIWGDGQLAFLGVADCTVDDGIEDTPNQGQPSNYVCDDTQNTCIDPAADLPDMYENYMDYADETCMVAFTAEQATFMRNVLMNQRSGLINNMVSVEETHSISLSIFPNPSNNHVNISVDNSQEFQLIISQMNGTKIHSDKYDGQARINTSTWAKGLYVVEIRQGKNTAVKKLVVM